MFPYTATLSRLFYLFQIYTYVILFGVFNGWSTSIKEINRLIWKGMSNKTSNFSERNSEEMI